MKHAWENANDLIFIFLPGKSNIQSEDGSGFLTVHFKEAMLGLDDMLIIRLNHIHVHVSPT